MRWEMKEETTEMNPHIPTEQHSRISRKGMHPEGTGRSGENDGEETRNSSMQRLATSSSMETMWRHHDPSFPISTNPLQEREISSFCLILVSRTMKERMRLEVRAIEILST